MSNQLKITKGWVAVVLFFWALAIILPTAVLANAPVKVIYQCNFITGGSVDG